MIGNMLETGFENFGMLDNAEGTMGNVASYAEPIAWYG
jgi:hypothetical protein